LDIKLFSFHYGIYTWAGGMQKKKKNQTIICNIQYLSLWKKLHFHYCYC